MKNLVRSVGRREKLLYGAAAFSLVAVAGWVAFRLGRDYEELPPALPGDQFDVFAAGGRIHVYSAGPDKGTPLLLVHSVNAAGSAYEVRPLFVHYRESRPVYAVDLPGFGLSDRLDRVYSVRTMTDAIHAAVEEIRTRHGSRPIDIIALSLSSEYVARAALERPANFRSLGLISPTGFDRVLSGNGPAQLTRGDPLKLAFLSIPGLSQALFGLVVSRASMRFFLQKTWGSKHIDEALFHYDQRAAHRPGARHAVWSFLSGYLFADDVSRIYRLLKLPVWAVHGRRGDFVDYRYEGEVEDKTNWSLDEFYTGAFPHFENLPAVTRSYDRFQNLVESEIST